MPLDDTENQRKVQTILNYLACSRSEAVEHTEQLGTEKQYQELLEACVFLQVALEQAKQRLSTAETAVKEREREMEQLIKERQRESSETETTRASSAGSSGVGSTKRWDFYRARLQHALFTIRRLERHLEAAERRASFSEHELTTFKLMQQQQQSKQKQTSQKSDSSYSVETEEWSKHEGIQDMENRNSWSIWSSLRFVLGGLLIVFKHWRRIILWISSKLGLIAKRSARLTRY